ncbi:MAG: glucosamine-6-phosphate deaminase [Rhodocyclaceae bacterium]|nr:MAG: glucosamine-6-phosphate deaminase [Rhodocyclaceae bacterium]
MNILVFDDTAALAEAAASQAATLIIEAISVHGRARILVATGDSQIQFLNALVRKPGVDWSKVEMFHLDEYVGLSIDHPASFRQYLLERFVKKTGLLEYHFLNGETAPEEVCREVGRRLAAAPIDVAFAGIGENGHLAFNDPPADFSAEQPYRVVQLDEACRRQQVNEGWFPRLADVPQSAISISIRQLLKAKAIIAVVPDARKASAVQRCLEEPIGPLAPASILRRHPVVTLYLDRQSASLLKPPPTAASDTGR